MQQTIEHWEDHSSDAHHWTLHRLAIQEEIQFHVIIAHTLTGDNTTFNAHVDYIDYWRMLTHHSVSFAEFLFESGDGLGVVDSGSLAGEHPGMSVSTQWNLVHSHQRSCHAHSPHSWNYVSQHIVSGSTLEWTGDVPPH